MSDEATILIHCSCRVFCTSTLIPTVLKTGTVGYRNAQYSSEERGLRTETPTEGYLHGHTYIGLATVHLNGL